MALPGHRRPARIASVNQSIASPTRCNDYIRARAGMYQRGLTVMLPHILMVPRTQAPTGVGVYVGHLPARERVTPTRAWAVTTIQSKINQYTFPYILQNTI